jgi:hypothetical protein
MLRGADHDLGLTVGRVASQRLQDQEKFLRKHSVNLADLCIPDFNESKWQTTQSLATDRGKWIRAATLGFWRFSSLCDLRPMPPDEPQWPGSIEKTRLIVASATAALDLADPSR